MGTSLASIAATLRSVSIVELAVLTSIWMAAVMAHTLVLTGAFEQLSRRRALTLNLTGRSVANVLPFGGAASLAMNLTMIRSWGIEVGPFLCYMLVPNIWVIALKFAIPLLALGVVLGAGASVSPLLVRTAVGVAITLGSVLLVSRLTSTRPVVRYRTTFVAAAAASPTFDRVTRPLGPEAGRAALGDWATLGGWGATARSMIRRRWAHLSVGLTSYVSLQALLLWAALYVVDAGVTPVQAFAAFAVDRVLTLLVLSPGGLGIADAGTAAVLAAMHGSSAALAAGVLLYRAFTFGIYIPVGGAWLGAWLLMRRRRPSCDGAGSPSPRAPLKGQT